MKRLIVLLLLCTAATSYAQYEARRPAMACTSGILKGDAAGNAVEAAAGVDYATPAQAAHSGGVIGAPARASTRRTKIRRPSYKSIFCAQLHNSSAKLIRERVNAGIAAARLREVRLGRPSRLGRHEEAVAGLMREGLGVCAIARKLKIPLSSAHKVVKRLKG